MVLGHERLDVPRDPGLEHGYPGPGREGLGVVHDVVLSLERRHDRGLVLGGAQVDGPAVRPPDRLAARPVGHLGKELAEVREDRLRRDHQDVARGLLAQDRRGAGDVRPAGRRVRLPQPVAVAVFPRTGRAAPPRKPRGMPDERAQTPGEDLVVSVEVERAPVLLDGIVRTSHGRRVGRVLEQDQGHVRVRRGEGRHDVRTQPGRQVGGRPARVSRPRQEQEDVGARPLICLRTLGLGLPYVLPPHHRAVARVDAGVVRHPRPQDEAGGRAGGEVSHGRDRREDEYNGRDLDEAGGHVVVRPRPMSGGRGRRWRGGRRRLLR
mmetsp:Transcript_6239/g.14390  ORF Transcript_6239/g.14390 Transcript_6239/m.14390 type:complete len:322 (-) Transcript_6239:58-1023(-)